MRDPTVPCMPIQLADSICAASTVSSPCSIHFPLSFVNPRSFAPWSKVPWRTIRSRPSSSARPGSRTVKTHFFDRDGRIFQPAGSLVWNPQIWLVRRQLVPRPTSETQATGTQSSATSSGGLRNSTSINARARRNSNPRCTRSWILRLCATRRSRSFALFHRGCGRVELR